MAIIKNSLVFAMIVGIFLSGTSSLAKVTKIIESIRRQMKDEAELIEKSVSDLNSVARRLDHLVVDDDRFLTMVRPDEFRKGGTVTKLVEGSDGKIQRTTYSLTPSEIEADSIRILDSGSTQKVERNFKAAGGDISLSQIYSVQEIKDRMGQTQTYRIVKDNWIEYGNFSAYTAIDNNFVAKNAEKVLAGRRLKGQLTFRGENTRDLKFELTLPAEANGQIIDHKINSTGSKLIVRTSEGQEFHYQISLEKLGDEPGGVKLKSDDKNPRKIAGGIESYLAKSMSIEGRTSGVDSNLRQLRFSSPLN